MEWMKRFVQEVPRDYAFNPREPGSDDRILGPASPELEAAFRAGEWHRDRFRKLRKEHQELHKDPAYEGGQCDIFHADLESQYRRMQTFMNAVVQEVYEHFNVTADFGGVALTTGGIAMSPPEEDDDLLPPGLEVVGTDGLDELLRMLGQPVPDTLPDDEDDRTEPEQGH